VELTDGSAVVTPAIANLCHRTWRNLASSPGHGYFLELDTFKSGWLDLDKLRKVDRAGRTYYESPALIGCAFAVARELYDCLWGFDVAMRLWGVEDLDFSLKCWLMGHAILHDPEAVIGHRFQDSFSSYRVSALQMLASHPLESMAWSVPWCAESDGTAWSLKSSFVFAGSWDSEYDHPVYTAQAQHAPQKKVDCPPPC
jgi:hypothetical protein